MTKLGSKYGKNFLFEVEQGHIGVRDFFVLPINPEEFRRSETPRASVTHTLGGVHVDCAGNGLTRINIKGTFTYKGSLSGGKGKHMRGEQKEGFDIALECEEMFLSFYEKYGDGEGDDSKIYFHSIGDGKTWQVKVDRFDLSRSIKRQFLYSYDIQLTGIARGTDDYVESASKKITDVIEATSLDISKTSGLLEINLDNLRTWQGMMDGYTFISNKMQDVITYAGSMESKLGQISAAVKGFVQNVTDVIEAPFGVVNAAIEDANSIIESVSSLEDIPHELTDLMRQTKRNLMNLGHSKDAFSAKVSKVDNLTNTPNDVSREYYEVATGIAPREEESNDKEIYRIFDPEHTLIDPSSEVAGEVAAFDIPIQENDTIESIAHRTLGSGADWQRVATVNNLDAPYIVKKQNSLDRLSPVLSETRLSVAAIAGERVITVSASSVPDRTEYIFLRDGEIAEIVEYESSEAGTNGLDITLMTALKNAYTTDAVISFHEDTRNVLLAGDRIKIPSTQEGSGVAQASGGREASLYRTDERVDQNGEQPVDGTGSFDAVSGLSNLKMQLENRLNTRRGELGQLGHPTYGCNIPLYVGRTNNDIYLYLAVLEAKRALLEDRRVKTVPEIEGQFNGSTLEITADVVPINSNSSERLVLVVT